MAGRRVHRPPYWRVIFTHVVSPLIWPRFDGWALSHGYDVLEARASRCTNLIEYYLEESATETKEIHDARNQHRAQLLRVAKVVNDMEDPDKIEQLANTPPHLLMRR